MIYRGRSRQDVGLSKHDLPALLEGAASPPHPVVVARHDLRLYCSVNLLPGKYPLFPNGEASARTGPRRGHPHVVPGFIQVLPCTDRAPEPSRQIDGEDRSERTHCFATHAEYGYPNLSCFRTVYVPVSLLGLLVPARLEARQPV